MARLVAPAVLVVAAVVALAVFVAGGDEHHRLRAAFDEAVQVVPGQEVRVAGRKVGSVASVRELDGDAIVEMKIAEGDWPLHRGTTARLRYGSLGGYAGRFVDLKPGPATAPALPDDGVLSTAATVTPVEFDQLFNAFDRRTRGDLRGVLDNTAATVDGHSGGVRSALRDGAPGIDALADLFAELRADPHALRTLVRAGARTSRALAGRSGALSALLDRAAGTFDELAGHARAQQAALDRLPGTLTAGRRTLASLSRSLPGLRGIVADIRPGARALREVAPVVRRTLATLMDVAPRATATLRSGRAAAPDVDRLLRRGTTFLPRAAAVLDELAPMLSCIRPYAPEIVGMASVWTRFSQHDEQAGYARADLTQLPPQVGAGSALTSQQITGLFKDRVFYALPRPPGLNAGQPWFLPECGAGRDALDPSKDPERR